MNLDELRGMSQDEQFKAVASHAGVRPEVLRNMWRVESGEGKSLRGPETKWGTAKGHFQILDQPKAEMERRFKREMNPDDFVDSLAMAGEMLRENMGRFGNEDNAVLAYHGGWNQKNWGPKTADYLTKVTGKAKAEAPAIQGKRADMAITDELGNVQNRIPASVLWHEKQSKAQGGNRYLDKLNKWAGIEGTSGDRDRPGFFGAQQEWDQLKAKEQTREDTSVGDIFGASYRESLRPYFRVIANLGIDREVSPVFLEEQATNGYKTYAEYTVDEQSLLMSANNERERDLYLHDIAERRGNQQVIRQGHMATQVATGLLAEGLNPVNYVAGVGVSMGLGAAGYGSYQLAKNGRKVAALGSSFGEGALGNVVTEAMIHASGETRTWQDYMVAGAMGVLPAAIQYPGLARAHTQAIFNANKKAAEEAKAKAVIQAANELGEGATSQAIAKRASQIADEDLTDALAVRVFPEGKHATVDTNIDARLAEEPALTQTTQRAPAGDPDGVEITPVLKGLQDQGTVVLTKSSDLKAVSEYANKYGVDVPEDATALYLPQEDRVFLLTDRMTPEQKANPSGLIAHEVGVHYGLERTVGVEGMAKIVNDINLSSDARAVAARAAVPDSVDARLRGEEMLGYLAEKNPDSPWVKRMVSSVRNFLRDNVRALRNMEVSVDDALQYIRGALKNARKGRLSSDLTFPYVWHGGPTKGINELDLAYSGTGEGNAAFGYGHYVSSELGTALDYRNKESIKRGQEKTDGGLYRLMVNAKQEDMLGWDTAATPEQLRLASLEEGTGQDVYKALTEQMGGAKEASEYLAANGIPGIKYQTGRTRGMENPNHNYVLFSNDALSMQARYSQRQPMPTDKARGLDMYPTHTDEEAVRKTFISQLHDTADAWVAQNPVNPERLKTIMQNSLVDARTPGLVLAGENNNLAKWVAGNLVEVTTGAAGRNPTAAIAKHSLEQQFIGDSIVKFDMHYAAWRDQAAGGKLQGISNDLTTYDLRARFMRDVAMYRDAIYYGRSVPNNMHPSVAQASQALDESYGLALDTAKASGVAGFDVLNKRPGYQPHMLNPDRIRDMTLDEQRDLRDVFTQQFQQYEGMDRAFAEYVADRYLAHARTRAAGNVGMPANVLQPNAMGWVLDALRQQGVPPAQLHQLAKAVPNRQNKRTMSRMEINMEDKVGQKQLVDFFQTDQIDLMRGYSRRTAGEVALTRWGIQGDSGLQLLREALAYGGGLTKKGWQSFDQVAAELTGKPFGDELPGFWEGAMTMNAMSNLGMTAIPQLTEGIRNAIGLGIVNTMKHSPDFLRMIGEVRALARGEKVNNPILSSMELPGGNGQHGLEEYKMITAFDSQSSVEANGGDVGPLLRLTRVAGKHLGTMNMTRLITAVQRRTSAMQITSAALRAARDGTTTKTLEDMGFTPAVMAAVKRDLGTTTQFDADGWVKSFDITTMPDDVREAFGQAVLRGTKQLIQGEWVGERAAYRYSALGKIMTQFRNFPLLAMEKQWARDRSNFGAARTMLMASAMAGASLPIYLARIAYQSMGRPEEDREEYLENALAPMALAKGVLNYVAWAGVLPDLMDGLTSVAQGVAKAGGAEIPQELMGTARAPGGSVLSSIVPGAGWLEAAGKAAVSPSWHKTARLVPFSGTPLLYPAVNLLRTDD